MFVGISVGIVKLLSCSSMIREVKERAGCDVERPRNDCVMLMVKRKYRGIVNSVD